MIKIPMDMVDMTNNEFKDNLLLAQWQTCVEMANSISQRRDTMNNIFITLNLTLMTAISIVWDIKSIFILVAGIIVCILWIFFIRNYKLLNTTKFEVINDIEKRLPCQPFSSEWDKLRRNNKYRDGTTLEGLLPVMFILLYFIAAVIVLASI